MQDILAFTTRLALETGELLKAYFSQTGIHAELKNDRTVVTDADIAADEKIRTAIHAAYPADQLLTEESATSFSDSSKPVWVIDPLDGTTNFSLGLPIWGVSIARLENGIPQVGALYFPMINELYTAQRGKGAKLNHKPLKIPTDREALSYSFFTCCSRTFRNYDVSLRYKVRILGAAAYDFCAVARGAAIVGFQSKVKLWDMAAGWLILEEAGGIADVHSGPHPLPAEAGQDYDKIIFPVITAVNQEMAQKAKQGIKKKTP